MIYRLEEYCLSALRSSDFEGFCFQYFCYLECAVLIDCFIIRAG